MRHTLAWPTLAFCLGIIIASIIEVNFILIYWLAFILAIFGLWLVNKERIFIAILFFLTCLLGIASLKNIQVLPKNHISKFIYYKNDNLYTIRGIIDNEPLIKNNRNSFIFKVSGIDLANSAYSSCGRVLVYTKLKRRFSYGEQLVLQGSLYRPFHFKASGRRSYRDYLYNNGIFAIMNAKALSPAAYPDRNKGRALKRFALWLKVKTEEAIFSSLSPLAAGILEAMVLGEKRAVPTSVYNSMIYSGTVHILVVSGFNVGIVASVIILVLRLLRIKRKIRIYLAIPLLIFYCLATGASTPVVRATIMAIVFLCAYLFKREPDIYNSLSLAALCILGVNPKQLFDVGFQLSFASVISIVWLYPKLKPLLRLENLKIRCLRSLLQGCLISLSAWLGTMGFIAYYFKIFSPVTILANLFIVPLAGLITLCGFSLILATLICPALAYLFSLPCELLVWLLIQINALLIRIPAAYFYLY